MRTSMIRAALILLGVLSGIVIPIGGARAAVHPNEDVSSFGSAQFHGSPARAPLAAPLVGMASTASGNGYWLLGRDGGIFSYGDAVFHGSTGAMVLNQPVVGLASDAKNRGYWFVASDGGVFAFGAPFFGSAGALPLTQPVVGMAATRTGNGYWLVARDGGIFSYGDAKFSGSTGAIRLNQPIVGMAADPDGTGYWFVAADGGVFAFDAPFMGSSVGALAADERVVGMGASGRAGGGYWLLTSRGRVLAHGTTSLGGTEGVGRNALAIVARPGTADGYWILTDHVPPTPPPAPAPARTFGDGTHRVGIDIPAGTYRTRADAPACYWERLAGFSGTFGDIKANNFTDAHDVVTISESDAGFKSEDCGTWTSDLSAITSSPTAPFGDGTWIVHTDIAAGTWRAPGGDGCYWARLKGFSGELGDIVANDFGSTSPTVTLTVNDKGFESDDCGGWTKIG